MRIRGRLSASFGSRVFNVKGTRLIFLPDKRPLSNTMDKWDICVWGIERKEITLTLKAHTDAIMWVGFSPNDKLIASVSWDKTFRISTTQTAAFCILLDPTMRIGPAASLQTRASSLVPPATAVSGFGM